MICARCKHTLPKRASFCPNCGATIRPQPGGVSTGGGGHFDGNVWARGDVVGGDQHKLDTDPIRGIVDRGGPPRAFLTVGLVVAFIGMALFLFAILSGAMALLPIGFGLLFVGIVIGNIARLI